jgi:hypothetical protein
MAVYFAAHSKDSEAAPMDELEVWVAGLQFTPKAMNPKALFENARVVEHDDCAV